MRQGRTASIAAFWILAAVGGWACSKSHSNGSGQDEAARRAAQAAAAAAAAVPAATPSAPAGTIAVNVSLAPLAPKATDTIQAKAAASSPTATISYTWYVDGVQVAGWIGDSLPPGRFKKKQKIAVEAVAMDLGGKVSPPARSEVTSVNSDPTLNVAPVQSTGASGVVTFQVQGNDPDGEPLTYSLPKPVAGVSLSAAGVLTVTTSAIPAGGVTIPVQVADQDGATASTEITVGPH